MCRLVTLKLNGKDVQIADIKLDCVRNIVDAAQKCKYIDKVVLFGSVLNEKCKEQSDIDIAVFGNVAKNKCLSSKDYKEFTHQLYRFDDFAQTYDILYFRSGSANDSFIRREIDKGEVIYG